MKTISALVVLLLFCSMLSAADKADPTMENILKLAKENEPGRRGYRKPMSISEAVKEFNLRQAANETGKTQPPLTEDEVLVAVLDGAETASLDMEVDGDKFEKLYNSVKKGVLPVGCYLDYLQGGTLDDAGKVKFRRWSVWLKAGLEANPEPFATYNSTARFLRLPIRLQTLDIDREK